MAMLEAMDSLPPRRTQTLPARKARLAASEVTLGRDSKMIAMTPSGTETLSTRSPFGSVWVDRIRPTGSGRPATARIPSAMSAMRPAVRRSRSSMTGETVPSARARSPAFAARMASVSSTRQSAMVRRTAAFCASSRAASAGLAA